VSAKRGAGTKTVQAAPPKKPAVFGLKFEGRPGGFKILIQLIVRAGFSEEGADAGPGWFF
jgi:hypothetical protein